MFVLKWFLIPVKYIYSKITIWSSDNISLIYLCWITSKEHLPLGLCEFQVDKLIQYL